eukprot:56406-Eustigmatos_ZCMA.PRE.1
MSGPSHTTFWCGKHPGRGHCVGLGMSARLGPGLVGTVELCTSRRLHEILGWTHHSVVLALMDRVEEPEWKRRLYKFTTSSRKVKVRHVSSVQAILSLYHDCKYGSTATAVARHEGSARYQR